MTWQPCRYRCQNKQTLQAVRREGEREVCINLCGINVTSPTSILLPCSLPALPSSSSPLRPPLVLISQDVLQPRGPPAAGGGLPPGRPGAAGPGRVVGQRGPPGGPVPAQGRAEGHAYQRPDRAGHAGGAGGTRGPGAVLPPADLQAAQEDHPGQLEGAAARLPSLAMDVPGAHPWPRRGSDDPEARPSRG